MLEANEKINLKTTTKIFVKIKEHELSIKILQQSFSQKVLNCVMTPPHKNISFFTHSTYFLHSVTNFEWEGGGRGDDFSKKYKPWKEKQKVSNIV